MFPLNVAAAVAAPRINLTDRTVFSIDVPGAGDTMLAGVRINADGTVQQIIGTDGAPVYQTVDLPDWNDLQQFMDQYEVQATSPDIVDHGDALATWFPLSASREWGALRAPPTIGITQAVITVQIRKIVSAQVLATGVFTCIAEQT